ncbi:MAG: aminotransferase class IV [Bacteroidetes bacterium]|nr:aminotransferase class IV [Bacteroidota bacterium]
MNDAFDLIETMRLWHGRVRFADRHAARMASSSAALGWTFDAARWQRTLREAAASEPDGASLLRVVLGSDGAMTYALRPLVPLAAPVRLAGVPFDISDPLLPLKTTRRDRYDDAHAVAVGQGADDALLVNAAGHVTETTRMNVFYRQDGRWHTPPLADGLLPGILRGVALERGWATERVLRIEDVRLVEAWRVGNSARGFFEATVFAP